MKKYYLEMAEKNLPPLIATNIKPSPKRAVLNKGDTLVIDTTVQPNTPIKVSLHTGILTRLKKFFNPTHETSFVGGILDFV